jgi:hypothetical protein
MCIYCLYRRELIKAHAERWDREMSFQLDDLKRDHKLRILLEQDDVRKLMELRCAEQGHDMENCCSPTFVVYSKCKWCGFERI